MSSLEANLRNTISIYEIFLKTKYVKFCICSRRAEIWPSRPQVRKCHGNLEISLSAPQSLCTPPPRPPSPEAAHWSEEAAGRSSRGSRMSRRTTAPCPDQGEQGQGALCLGYQWRYYFDLFKFQENLWFGLYLLLFVKLFYYSLTPVLDEKWSRMTGFMNFLHPDNFHI